MKGLELSRRYYLEVGRPMLVRKFPEYLPRIAAGLVGEGSECLGYDDEISRDHDFGPGFCLWLTGEDYQRVGKQMQEAYENLPDNFMGFGARKTGRMGRDRVGVMEISEFYRRFIGDEQPPSDMMRWLYLPEDKLAAVSSGEVFEDPLGEFSAVRAGILAYYPEDVRVKKIAARAAVMAQAGQYNYARCMRRGDFAAAFIAQSEFIRSAVSMLYLLNRRYMPFYKWMFRGLSGMKVLSEARECLDALVCLGSQSDAWSEPYPADWNPYVNLHDRKVMRIEQICAMVVDELKRQGLTDRNDDFLEVHAWDIMKRIQDSQLAHCHVLAG